MFCFFGKTQSDGELCAAERSCYECESCFSLDTKEICKNQKYTGPIHTEINIMLEAPPKADPTMTAQHNQLQDALKIKIKRDNNIVVRLQSGKFAIGKAAGKPYELKESTGKGGEWINKGTSKHPVYVVEMYQYEANNKGAKDPFGCTYLLGNRECETHRYLCDCGTAAAGGPCYKRHLTMYRLRDVREPVGFTLQTPRQSHRNNSSSKRQKNAAAATDDRLRYLIPAALKQKIEQNLNVVRLIVEGEADAEAGASTSTRRAKRRKTGE